VFCLLVVQLLVPVQVIDLKDSLLTLNPSYSVHEFLFPVISCFKIFSLWQKGANLLCPPRRLCFHRHLLFC